MQCLECGQLITRPNGCDNGCKTVTPMPLLRINIRYGRDLYDLNEYRQDPERPWITWVNGSEGSTSPKG